jgi:hypothetical protein
MKNSLLTNVFLSISLLLLVSNKTLACDVCSTTSNSGGIGWLTQRNQVGLFYLGQNFRTYDGFYSNAKKVKENYNTLLLSGSYFPIEWLGIQAQIPVHFHQRTYVDKEKLNTKGFGDPTLIVSVNKTWERNSLTLKGQAFVGSKFSLVDYQTYSEYVVNPSFQRGSGGFDYLLGGQLNVLQKKNLYLFKTAFTLKTENDIEFKFGNQWQTEIGYLRKWNNTKLPSIGISLEHLYFNKNQTAGYIDHNTGGFLFTANILAKYEYKKYNFLLNYKQPLKQNLNKNRLINNSGITLGINYQL